MKKIIKIFLVALGSLSLFLPNFSLNLITNQIQAEQETLSGGAALELEIEPAVKLSQNKIAPVIQNGKVVMFEASHNQDPYNDSSYWIEDLEADGYTILVNTEPLSSQAIETVDVLIVSVLRHNYSISSPYTASEAQIIKQYVSKGGGLMVLADHGGYSWYAQEISLAFGVTLNGETILKQPIFNSANFDAGHPIMAGISSIGYNWYTTITPGTASPLIWENDGDAVAVTFSEGSGRGAVFGDSNWPLSIFNNYYWADNSLLALQTVDWLANQIDQNQPPSLSSPNQYKSDAVTEIQEGKITTESTVAFKVMLSDPDNDKIKIQVELRQKEKPFTGINDGGILNSDFINSGSEAVIIRYGLVNGQYHWRVRAVDDKGGFSEWREFGEEGNVDFMVKTVPLYTQTKSPYPSDDQTKAWAIQQLGNGGIGGFAEYRFSLTAPANYNLTINGKDDNAANSARATVSVGLYNLSNGFKVFRTMSWPSGDDVYKDISSDLGALPKGDYLLRITSSVDYFDIKYKTTKNEIYDLNIYLDWLKITNTTIPNSPEIKMEAEDWTKLKGGAERIEGNKTIVMIDGYSCGRTIADCGCAMTSMVMLGRYYDIDLGINNSAVDPGNLNSWLADNNGYTTYGGIWWGKGIEYLGFIENDKKKVRLSLDHHNATSTFSFVDNDYINKAKPAIGQSKKFGHFIVVDGKIKFGSSVNDYTHTIKDPWWYNTKILRETKNIANHIQNYNNYYDTANLFSYLDTPKTIASSIWIYLASPAEFLITDPLGRKLGKDPITGMIYNEIPESSYTSEYSIASSDEPIDTDQLHEIKAIYIPTPVDGKYIIQVIGTDSGSYTIGLLMYDQEGESQNLTLKGNTSLNDIREYELDFSLENIQETEIYRITGIDIKPCSFPNSINLKSKGVTPVAVLTDEFFDAKNIVIDSVLFAGAKPTKGKLEDIDNDGDLDLILHFDTQSLQLNLNDTEAFLTGQLTNGNLIKGVDFVRIVK